MQYVTSLIDLIGNTPLLRLSTSLATPDGPDLGDAAPGRGPLVLAKVEYLNPGGSVKDRIATRMIEAAEASLRAAAAVPTTSCYAWVGG